MIDHPDHYPHTIHDVPADVLEYARKIGPLLLAWRRMGGDADTYHGHKAALNALIRDMTRGYPYLRLIDEPNLIDVEIEIIGEILDHEDPLTADRTPDDWTHAPDSYEIIREDFGYRSCVWYESGAWHWIVYSSPEFGCLDKIADGDASTLSAAVAACDGAIDDAECDARHGETYGPRIH